MSKKSQIVEYWYNQRNSITLFGNKFDLDFITDIGEPTCFICGCWWGTDYDNHNINATNQECFNLWNKVNKLQICHLLPKSLGGDTSPENLILMCSDCHTKTPDINNRELMLFYLINNKENWFNDLMPVFDKLVLQLNNLDKDFVKKLLNQSFLNKSKEYKSFLRNNSICHFGQNGNKKYLFTKQMLTYFLFLLQKSEVA